MERANHRWISCVVHCVGVVLIGNVIDNKRLIQPPDHFHRSRNSNPENWTREATAPRQTANLSANQMSIDSPGSGRTKEWKRSRRNNGNSLCSRTSQFRIAAQFPVDARYEVFVGDGGETHRN